MQATCCIHLVSLCVVTLTVYCGEQNFMTSIQHFLSQNLKRKETTAKNKIFYILSSAPLSKNDKLGWTCSKDGSIKQFISLLASFYLETAMVTIYTTRSTLNNSSFCSHSVLMCFVWIPEQTVVCFYNEHGMSSLWGTCWFLMYNTYLFWSSWRRSEFDPRPVHEILSWTSGVVTVLQSSPFCHQQNGSKWLWMNLSSALTHTDELRTVEASPRAHLLERHSARRVHVPATLSGMPYEQTQHPIIAQNVDSFSSWHYAVRA